MTLKKIVYVLAIGLLLTGNYVLAKKKVETAEADSTFIKKILIAQIDYGRQIDGIDDSKVEAAMNLAAVMSGKYSLISYKERDSAISALRDDKQKTTAAAIAKFLSADRIYFFRINNLENMLQVQITVPNSKNARKSKTGTGYALINYRDKKTDQKVYDPSLLKAIQRAFAVVEGDSLMFSSAEGPFKVFPAPTLVIGGIDFQNTNKLPDWKIYEKKTETSFDATEVMFETIKKSPKFVVYDNASRDSIYALFNMHIVENYRPPTSHEMEALSKLEVEYYLTGTMNRIAEGAQIDLYYCSIKNKYLDILKTETSVLKSDDLEEMRKVVREMTGKLLGLE